MAKCSTCILAAASEFSAWACCLKRWVLSSTPQSRRGCANSQDVPGKIWERTPSLKSEAKPRKSPPLSRNGVLGNECGGCSESGDFFQPTTQPTTCDVLYDSRVFWQSPRSCKLL